MGQVVVIRRVLTITLSITQMTRGHSVVLQYTSVAGKSPVLVPTLNTSSYLAHWVYMDSDSNSSEITLVPECSSMDAAGLGMRLRVLGCGSTARVCTPLPLTLSHSSNGKIQNGRYILPTMCTTRTVRGVALTPWNLPWL